MRIVVRIKVRVRVRVRITGASLKRHVMRSTDSEALTTTLKGVN